MEKEIQKIAKIVIKQEHEYQHRESEMGNQLTLKDVDRVLKPVKLQIKDCLKLKTRHDLLDILRNKLQEQEYTSKQLIYKCYLNKPRQPLNQTAEILNISGSVAREIIDRVKEELRQALSSEVQKDLPLSLDRTQDRSGNNVEIIDRVNKRISKFVDNWLEDKDLVPARRQNQDETTSQDLEE